MDTDEGWKRGGAFAGQAQKGMDMELDTGSDRTVKPYSSGILVGRLRTRPHGTIPKSSLSAGAYAKRRGTLDIYGELDWVQLDDTHAAITPGVYLLANGSSPGRYSLSASTGTVPTNVVAIESRDQNETGYIQVYKLPGFPK